MKSKLNISTLFVLSCIFLGSVLVRLPNINRPLSKHHEFTTAISLRVISIFYTDGIIKYRFNPVMNYPGSLNKHINNHASTTGGIKDNEGNYYYISHPPFGFILPLLVHKALQIEPSVLSIQIFHLCINFLSALFIYLIICLLLKSEERDRVFIPALIGFTIYLFNPAVLWFQCNTYMSDMLVHVFFIICTYFILKLTLIQRQNKKSDIFYYSFFLFLMIYTSWLGVLYALVTMIYCIYKVRNDTRLKDVLLASFLTVLIGLSLIFFQYSQIAGFDALKEQFLNRIGERSLPGTGTENYFFILIKSVLKIAFTYVTSYLPLFLFLIIVGGILIRKLGFKGVKLIIDPKFALFSVVPVFVLHFLLLNYSEHDFVSLYASMFLSVLIAVLFSWIINNGLIKKHFLYGGIITTIVFSIGMYYFINRPGPYSVNGDKYSRGKEIAQYIKENASENEVIFYSGSYPVYPEIVLYAKRNIKQIKDKDEGIEFMKINSISRAFWFHINDKGSISHENLINE